MGVKYEHKKGKFVIVKVGARRCARTHKNNKIFGGNRRLSNVLCCSPQLLCVFLFIKFTIVIRLNFCVSIKTIILMVSYLCEVQYNWKTILRLFLAS